jgi:flagellar motor switch protein FliN/FliY
MLSIPASTIEKFGHVQSQIWQTVSLTVSEASGLGINFTSPDTSSVKTSELYGDLVAPMMVIQFAFANLPESTQVVVIPQDTITSMIASITGNPVGDIDENIVAELRGPMEAVVQGVCLSVGNIKNETIVASGLNIRFQVFSFPPNLQRAEEIVRVKVAVGGEDVSGSVMWLMDSETAHMILGLVPSEEEYSNPFGSIGGGAIPAFGGGAVPGPVQLHDENNGLELLMDIPLEISVELGRVKMLVRDVVELSTGSIVEIDKAAGEPVDVMVNGRLVARGEVVVIEDNFGVRITEILNPHERLTRLGDAA